jgi:hypothetical protein
MAIVEITPKKRYGNNRYNYMVVPDQLIEAKSQFRVLKDNQYMMPVLELLQKHYLGNITVASTTFLFDGQSETLKQSGNEVGFSKNY